MWTVRDNSTVLKHSFYNRYCKDTVTASYYSKIRSLTSVQRLSHWYSGVWRLLDRVIFNIQESTRNMRQLFTEFLFPGLTLPLSLFPRWQNRDSPILLLPRISQTILTFNLSFKADESASSTGASYLSEATVSCLDLFTTHFAHGSL